MAHSRFDATLGDGTVTLTDPVSGRHWFISPIARQALDAASAAQDAANIAVVDAATAQATASAALPKVGGTMGSGAAVTFPFPADSGNIPLEFSFGASGAPTPAVPPVFYWSFQDFANPVTEAPNNPTTRIGWNVSPTGELVNPDYGSVFIHCEGGYSLDPTSRGTEWRVAVLKPGGSFGPDSISQIACAHNWVDNHTQLSFFNDEVDFFRPGTATPLLTISSTGVTSLDGITIDTNNIAGLSQKDSVGFIARLLKFNASNRLEVMPDGQVTNFGGNVFIGGFDPALTGRLVVKGPVGNTNPILTLNNYASDQTNVDIRQGTIDPNAVIPGNAGDIYLRVSGDSSNLYVNRSVSDPGTTWIPLL